MKENTVLLNVEEYNKLRDFYKGIHEGKFVTIKSRYGDIYYFEEKEVLEKLKKEIEILEKDINYYRKPNIKIIDSLKKMSLWQFYKWRNKYQN